MYQEDSHHGLVVYFQRSVPNLIKSVTCRIYIDARSQTIFFPLVNQKCSNAFIPFAVSPNQIVRWESLSWFDIVCIWMCPSLMSLDCLSPLLLAFPPCLTLFCPLFFLPQLDNFWRITHHFSSHPFILISSYTRLYAQRSVCMCKDGVKILTCHHTALTGAHWCWLVAGVGFTFKKTHRE